MAPNPKKSLTKYSSLCDEKVNKALKFIDDNKDGLTTRTLPIAEAHAKVIQDQFSKMEKKWQDDFMDEVMDDDTLYDELSNMVKIASTKVEKCVDKLTKILKEYDLGTGASASSLTKSPKMDNSFKPPILPASSNLEEFYSWEAQFLGHLKLNEAFLKETNQETCRLFITCLLDSKIQAALNTDVSVTIATPIKSTGEEKSILKWLKDHLLRHSPLFIRRYEYSNCRQKLKESFGDWWTRKLMKAKECDLDKVDVESIQITELICGIVDQRLREDILRLKDPTLEVLVAMGKRYDTSAKIQKDNFGGEEAQVNKISEYKKARNDKFDKARENNATKSKCKHCGWFKCQLGPDNVCKAKNMECHACGRKGHISPACRSKEEVVKSNVVRAMGIKVETSKASPDWRNWSPEKLSLNKDLEFFLGWKAELFNFVDSLDHNWPEFPLEDLLEPQLLELVEERMGDSVEIFKDSDFECFVNELHDIFEDHVTDDEDQIEDALDDEESDVMKIASTGCGAANVDFAHTNASGAADRDCAAKAIIIPDKPDHIKLHPHGGRGESGVISEWLLTKRLLESADTRSVSAESVPGDGLGVTLEESADTRRVYAETSEFDPGGLDGVPKDQHLVGIRGRGVSGVNVYRLI